MVKIGDIRSIKSQVYNNISEVILIEEVVIVD